MGRGLLLVGTDTGAGKTTVGVGLLLALRARGVRAAPYKPVETGAPRRGGRWLPRDAARLLRASGAGLALSEVCPFPYRTPVAPAVAARLERRPLSIGRMVEGYRKLARRFDVVVVETAGGLLTPLTARRGNADLVEALRLPAVVVARNRLGVLNHALLTLEALRSRRVRVAALVLNGRDGSPAGRSNLRALRERVEVPVLPFPRCRDLPALRRAAVDSGLVAASGFPASFGQRAGRTPRGNGERVAGGSGRRP